MPLRPDLIQRERQERLWAPRGEVHAVVGGLPVRRQHSPRLRSTLCALTLPLLTSLPRRVLRRGGRRFETGAWCAHRNRAKGWQ
ncbi:hypothetical protein NDU88_003184 [Pleurodeles waltl]|uniref:Uncharacterized protein n=1 Tax=Pleurodeles waltl TaxID=8319 RepID=A0AAV7Q9B3_PLEWA|nr:hypothetical protein NDU88_003184 [Pleurodeles waltl]